MNQTISKTESSVLHTYNRYDLVLEKSCTYLYDRSEKVIWTLAPGSALVPSDMEMKDCSRH